MIAKYTDLRNGNPIILLDYVSVGANYDINGKQYVFFQSGTTFIDPAHDIFISAPLWTAADITTALWLDAADASTITEVTGVSNWADKSTVGTRDVAQATTSKQPAYNSPTKTISFDGGDSLVLGTPFLYALGGMSCYSVMSNPAAVEVILGESSTVDDNSRYYIRPSVADNSKMAITIKNSTGTTDVSAEISATGAFDNTTKIYHHKDSGTAISGRVNGGNEVSVAYTRTGLFTPSNFAIGAGISVIDFQWMNGAINEIIITDGTEDTATRQYIEGYLAWKWDGINGNNALVTALPALHPYKLAPPTA